MITCSASRATNRVCRTRSRRPSSIAAIAPTLIGRTGLTSRTAGRSVRQIASVLPAQCIVDASVWPKWATIGRIDSLRIVDGKESELEQRYYISSRALTAAELATAVRVHWGIENRLHWVLDVSMGEDGSTLRKDHAPQNVAPCGRSRST